MKADHDIIIKQININLDYFDKLVNDNILSREELTDIVMRRHILAMKYVLKYAERNLKCKVTYKKN